MADYINIRGQSIEVVASDPANPTIGQIWYNSTSNTLKGGGVTTAGSWATGNNMNTARSSLAGAGTQTEAFGGLLVQLLQQQQKNMTEQLGQQVLRFKYSKNSLAGAGTQTAGLAFGGLQHLQLHQQLQEQLKNIMVQLGLQ
jgi:hypothetical protein